MATNGRTQSKTLGLAFAVAFGLTAWGQTQSPLGYSVATPRPISPAEGTTTPSAQATQRQKPYLGSVPSKTGARIELSLRSALERGLRYNLGLIEANQASADARAGRRERRAGYFYQQFQHQVSLLSFMDLLPCHRVVDFGRNPFAVVCPYERQSHLDQRAMVAQFQPKWAALRACNRDHNGTVGFTAVLIEIPGRLFAKGEHMTQSIVLLQQQRERHNFHEGATHAASIR